jgi:hypothetical protein
MTADCATTGAFAGTASECFAVSSVCRSLTPATASRLAAMRMWLQRSSMARDIWPNKASMVDSDALFSASLVAKECRRSCRRQDTPVSDLSWSQPQVISVAWRVGSRWDPERSEVCGLSTSSALARVHTWRMTGCTVSPRGHGTNEWRRGSGRI